MTSSIFFNRIKSNSIRRPLIGGGILYLNASSPSSYNANLGPAAHNSTWNNLVAGYPNTNFVINNLSGSISLAQDPLITQQIYDEELGQFTDTQSSQFNSQLYENIDTFRPKYFSLRYFDQGNSSSLDGDYIVLEEGDSVLKMNTAAGTGFNVASRTVECWTRIKARPGDPTTTNYTYVDSNGANTSILYGDARGITGVLRLLDNGNDTCNVCWTWDDSGFSSQYHATESIPLNTWVQIVTVLEPSDAGPSDNAFKCSYYINGVSAGSIVSNDTNGIDLSQVQTWFLGRDRRTTEFPVGSGIRYGLYTHCDIAIFRQYNFALTADQIFRNYESIRDRFSIPVGDTFPPTQPQNVTATVSVGDGQQITLSWDASTDVGSGVAYYQVQRSRTSADGPWGPPVQVTGATSLLQTLLRENTTYYYQVRAIDNNNNVGLWSATATATTGAVGGGDVTAPTIPGSVSASTLSSSSINVAWTASTDAESGIKSYTVQRSTDQSNWTSFTTSATSFIFTNLSASTTYYFRVAATDNADNQSNFSSTVNATTQASSATSATIVVYNDGGLSDGGTHTSIANAIAAATAGSIIELRNRTAGAQVIWNQTMVFANKSGTATNPIRLRVRDGDSVILSVNNTSSGILLNFNNSSHIIVEGNSSGRTGLILGDETQWNPTTYRYSHRNGVYAANSQFITLRRLTCHGGSAYNANIFELTCQQIHIDDTEFSLHGTNSGGEETFDGKTLTDWGDLVMFSAKDSLVENTLMKWGGHNVFALTGYNNIIRNCIFDASWVEKDTGHPGNRAAVNVPASYKSGARIPLIDPGIYGPTLWENCVFKNAARAIDAASAPAQTEFANHSIFRNNLWYDNDGQMIAGPWWNPKNALWDLEPPPGKTVWYHNTGYNNAGIWYSFANLAESTKGPVDGMDNYRFINNVFAETKNGKRTGATLQTDEYVWDVFSWSTQGVRLEGYPNMFKGSIIRDNIFQGISTKFNVKLNATVIPLDGSNSNFTNNIRDNDVIGTTALNFVNAAARTFAGLSISSGLGKGDAAPLTLANGSGTNSITLIVDDSRFFCDGWGILQEKGDYIRVGGTVVQISDVNYNTNTITLATPISWSNDAEIYYAGKSGVAWTDRGINSSAGELNV